MSHIIDIMKQTMKKKSINSENIALSFPLHVKMKKLKILNSSKKIYNTKYVDNRTMQRLRKRIVRPPFLILLFDVHSFHGETIYFLHFNFSSKAVFSCKFVCCTKHGRPLQQESYSRNTLYFLVSAIFLPFFVDFQADRPATLIFVRDHRG